MRRQKALDFESFSMKNLFEAATVDEVKERMAQLRKVSGCGANESSAGAGALLRAWNGQ
jgi:hypothetical protein